MPIYVGCGPNLTQTLSPVLALKNVSHPDVSIVDSWGPWNAQGSLPTTSSLNLFILQCLIFPIWKMRIILSVLPPLQNCCENQNNICGWLWGAEGCKELYDLKVVSSSHILFCCPQRLYISAEWCQTDRRNAFFCCNPMKGLLRWGGEEEWGFP